MFEGTYAKIAVFDVLQVNIVGKELGLGFAGIGYEPKWPLSARPSMPKVCKPLLIYTLLMPGRLESR